ncbi:hypothetical protein GCM10009765_28370 [Fodinicola feengrottensis]|uniref:Uncharacterized protein n=1 Tax=Fodinicola feengrottensis TaxID=435914 RepID=A0ABN2GV95_9ACTN
MPPCVSGAFGAGAVDYGYESPPSRPRKDRGALKADAPAGGATTSAWRPMAPDGAWVPSKLTNLMVKVVVCARGGYAGLGLVEVGQLWVRGDGPARARAAGWVRWAVGRGFVGGGF